MHTRVQASTADDDQGNERDKEGGARETKREGMQELGFFSSLPLTIPRVVALLPSFE